MKKLISPLRYPGSKRRLAGFIQQAIELNELAPQLYVEPFAGGASIALQLLANELVDQVILIDRDPLIAHFWHTLFFDTQWLVNQIKTIPISLEKWDSFRAQQPKSRREYAIKCLFLNRTSFSGILENGAGPLGGRKQESKYPIDCRFPRVELVNRVEKIASFREHIAGVWALSWQEGLEKISKLQKKKQLPKEQTFFYLDPPFFQKAERLYRFTFEDNDHKTLRDTLVAMKDFWILSYDSVDHVQRLYDGALENGTNGTKQHDIELVYTTGVVSRTPSKEVILSNLPKLPCDTKFWQEASGLETILEG
jgi:DNA adenine methylase